ncbi:ribosomal-processing cysteine protease Prp [Alicyclobacillus sp. ALC3]|uniref:ribosomal-processing cysteine protease Prp n=1 Tax=Alicyclobacillus sp. ALC3 TaxID=2796143 RepID=UPI002378B9B1|nr:ribosomal-processing cysteine protease Prp [Alicyclobacillus sp. ALC3]WDL96999.1 ribosomal-processing cysteine protease Prp [Alicyclobacillus sp. ALC3]
MIRARVERVAGVVTAFRVSGHGGYGEAGEDVVCAAVSALVLNAVNSCEQLLGVALPAEDDGDVLSCSVPDAVRDDSGIQLLLESMWFGLQQTAEQYPHHITLREIRLDQKE